MYECNYEMELENIIRRIVSVNEISLTNLNLFDMVVSGILEYHDKPVHSLSEMTQRRRTKTKGDLWEVFCKLYLKNIKGYDDVWLLSEIPDGILEELSLCRRDVGIDIIARKAGKYTAVQCKFKRPREGLVPGTWIAYNCVNWKELSTFYALCYKTNGNKWQNHIVMTNTKYVRHMGGKTTKDKSICVGTFNKLTRMDLLTIINGETNIVGWNITIGEENTVELKEIKKDERGLDVSELRLARLNFFEGDNK